MAEKKAQSKKPATKKAAPNAAKAKAAAKKVAKKVELNPLQVYSFKANAKAKHLLDGQIYKISGEIASGLIDKGWGEIID